VSIVIGLVITTLAVLFFSALFLRGMMGYGNMPDFDRGMMFP
jgi:hypothetical protein